MVSECSGVSANDLSVLRQLGDWVAMTAETRENREKIQAWLDHDAGRPDSRVMAIAETWYLSDACKPVNDADLRCTDPWARNIEYWLRYKQYEIDVLHDDHTVLPWINYSPTVHATDFGVPSSIHHEAGADPLAFQYHAALTTLDDAELGRLRPREFSWDRAADERERERLEAVFAGILGIRRRNQGWQLHLPITSTCLNFVGLEGFMSLMYENPEGLHRLLGFIRDDRLAFLQFLEDQHLLELNNENDYIGSGCMGYSAQLPAADFAGTVRAKDLWFFSESQESVSISPAFYGEFVFPYLRAIAEKFGRVYYGCCEGVDPIWPYISTLPNLQRVSVSPWADEEKIGAFCRQRNVVYSRKPSPNLFMGACYDEAAARAHLEKTVACAQGCRLEFIHRDVYTVNNEPERFVRWVELVREVASTHRASSLLK